jgi:hypothetical protein
MSMTTLMVTVPIELISWFLLGVLIFAAIALLCCALAGYIDAWRDSAADDPHNTRAPPEESLFASDWFFYLNALLCFVSMLGLIFCL